MGKQAPVAQLDRAAVYGTAGWGFESLRVYLSFQALFAFWTLRKSALSEKLSENFD